MKLKSEVDMEEKESYIARTKGAVVVDYDTSKFFEANETGALLLKKLRKDTTIEALVDIIYEEFEVDKETALKDVKEFVSKLEKFGLIEE
ncbi:MAG: PqqD family protein [Candidatus Helarchaeota archaeon]|nr:PqqD family protein [Candidatus Helarchaeota archaeon]